MPRALSAVGASVVALSVVMLFLGAWTTGVAWDETYHVMRLRNFFQSGWFLTDYDLVEGRPRLTVHDRYVYGPIAMLLLHALSTVVGADTWGAPEVTSAAFAWRHVGVVLLSLLTAAMCAATARLILRRWDWALLSAAVLFAIPVWSGHSMMNIKDVPVAAGYTTATLGMVLLLALARTGDIATTRLLGVGALLCAGTTLSVGTRPGIWPGIAAGLGLTLVILVTSAPRAKWRPLMMGAGLLVGAPAVAVVLLAVIYDQLFTRPWELLLGSAARSAQYRGGMQSDPFYVPVQVLVQVPPGVVALALAGAAATLIASCRMRPGALLVLPVVSQAGLLPLLAVLSGSDLYNGLRQLLFAGPAVAVLGTIGIERVVVWSRAVRGGRHVASAVVGLALLLPTVAQLRLFPYGYTYFTPVAELAGVVPDTDFWRTSARELAQDVPPGRRVVCSPYVGTGGALRYGFDGNEDCRTDATGPLAPYVSGSEEPGPSPVGETFLAVLERVQFVPDNCERVAAISRELRLQELVMTQLLRCRLSLPPAPHRLMRFTTGGDAWHLLYEGWAMLQHEQGVQTAGRTAQLAFVWDRAAGAGVLELVMSNRSQVSIAVDGRPELAIGRSTRPRLVEVPLRRLEVDQPVDITLSSESGPLSVQLRTMQIRGGERAMAGQRAQP